MVKWLLEGRRSTEHFFGRRKLHITAKTGTVAPLSRFFFFSQKKSLSGRLSPFINFGQIFTKHHMP